MLRISGGAQNTVAAVIQCHTRHAQCINFQIQNSTVHQLFFGMQNSKQSLCKEKTGCTHKQTDDQTDHKGGMHGFDHGFPVPCTQLMRHPHINTAAHSDQKAGKQRDQKRCRTNCPQCPVIRKSPYHRYVTHIKQHFQHLGKYQRAAQEKQVLPDRTCCHFYCFCFLFSHHSPVKAFLSTESASICAFSGRFSTRIYHNTRRS